MKLIYRGVLLILILLSSSYISISKEISHYSRRIKSQKLNSKNSFKNNKFSSKKNSNKNRRTNVTNRLNKADWESRSYLLNVAFLKGLCSQIDTLNKFEPWLEGILNPSDAAAKFVCNKVVGYVGKDFETKSEESNQTEAVKNSVTSLTLSDSDKEKLEIERQNVLNEEAKKIGNDKLDEILDDKTKPPENIKLDLSSLKTIDKVDVVPSEIDAILKVLKEYEPQDMYFKKNWFAEMFYDRRKKYSIHYDSKIYSDKIKSESREELNHVYSNCLKQYVFDKISEMNQYNIITATLFYPYASVIEDNSTNNHTVYYTIAMHKDFYDILSQKLIKDKNSCKEKVITFYENKKKIDSEVNTKDTDLKSQLNDDKSLLSSVGDTLLMLINFALNFFRKIAVCISSSLITQIAVFAFGKLVSMITKLLSGISSILSSYYVIKFIYFISMAIKTEDENIEETKKKEKKREKAEYYGKALGSLINALSSYFGARKRKSKYKKLSKRFKKN